MVLLLSSLQGFKECFVPFTPRKTIGWISVIQVIIISACFGSSVFLVAFGIVPKLSITSVVISIIALLTGIIGVVGFALDHPEVYLAIHILSLIITCGNMLTLLYFTYIAIDLSMRELNLPVQERWMESKGEKFNPLIGIVSAAFATETVLFITSAFIAIRARANAIVRIENEEIDALLQDAEENISNYSGNRSWTEQVEAQTRLLNCSRANSSRRDSLNSFNNSLTQSQQSLLH